MVCELCDLEKKTKWYYEDNEYIICDCETCKIPMIVDKKHGARFVESGTFEYGLILGLVKGVFGGKEFQFRRRQRKILDHWHWHIIFIKN